MTWADAWWGVGGDLGRRLGAGGGGTKRCDWSLHGSVPGLSQLIVLV